MYWKAWELAFTHLRTATPPLVADYIDEAYSEKTIFQWDTIFMLMFWRYAHGIFPAIKSLDNFYSAQHSDGYICREIRKTEPNCGEDFHDKHSDQAINPPLFAWAEVEYSRVSGDSGRFESILPMLERYADWLEENRIHKPAQHGLFWNSPFGCGMDFSPQEGSAWVEMSAQMVRQYRDLAHIAATLNLEDKVENFQTRARQIASRMNELMWDKSTGFCWNLSDQNQWLPARTISILFPQLCLESRIFNRHGIRSPLKHLDSILGNLGILKDRPTEPESQDLTPGRLFISNDSLTSYFAYRRCIGLMCQD